MAGSDSLRAASAAGMLACAVARPLRGRRGAGDRATDDDYKYSFEPRAPAGRAVGGQGGRASVSLCEAAARLRAPPFSRHRARTKAADR